MRRHGEASGGDALEIAVGTVDEDVVGGELVVAAVAERIGVRWPWCGAVGGTPGPRPGGGLGAAIAWANTLMLWICNIIRCVSSAKWSTEGSWCADIKMVGEVFAGADRGVAHLVVELGRLGLGEASTSSCALGGDGEDVLARFAVSSSGCSSRGGVFMRGRGKEFLLCRTSHPLWSSGRDLAAPRSRPDTGGELLTASAPTFRPALPRAQRRKRRRDSVARAACLDRLSAAERAGCALMTLVGSRSAALAEVCVCVCVSDSVGRRFSCYLACELHCVPQGFHECA